VEDVEKARGFLEAGRIGEVVLFEIAFAGAVDMSRRWNSDPDIAGGGVLIDNGTHAVDLIRHLAGPVSEVQACEGRRVQGLEVEDTAQLFVKTENGVVGHVDLSWSLDKRQAYFLEIYGTEGLIRVGWQASFLERGGEEAERFGRGYDKVGAFRSQLEDFSSALRTGSELRISAQDALSSVQVIEAAYRSLRERRWQDVATPRS
jgi:predicted dehydrogenase